MTRSVFLVIVGLSGFVSTAASSAELPVCSNRIINTVTGRVGCTLGDAKCWLTKGGFCTDYIQNLASGGRTGTDVVLDTRIPVGDVKKGDVAQFLARPHYAYVEGVVRDVSGRVVAVDLSEYNFGTCLVDRATMVTDQYKIVGRRSGVPVAQVDGGFWRPRLEPSSTPRPSH